MISRITPLFPTKASERRSAFVSSFGIPGEHVRHEFRVKREADGSRTGCNVACVSLCIHCNGPHLEVVSHILESAYPATVSDALEANHIEDAVLLTPVIETLDESGDTYPAGSPTDMVISRRAITASLAQVGSEEHESIIIRIPKDNLVTDEKSGEIRDWPYLTVEAAGILHERFQHVRTNAPSIEKQHSQGGMWSHAIFFGIDPDRSGDGQCLLEKRTVGELFHLPDQLIDGECKLLCPFHEVGLECAITLPMLIS
jgi:hypothetical protein